MVKSGSLSRLEEKQRQWEEARQAEVQKLAGRAEGAPPPRLVPGRLYTPADVAHVDYERDLGFPGEYPYTRGIQPSMYTGRFWTMGEYAGFGMPRETNERFRYLLKHGAKQIVVAFDLPTQLGYDSDDPRAAGEVGVVGTACPSRREMETIVEGIPLDQVSGVLGCNAQSQVMLAQFLVAAERQGVTREKVSGTTQNDILKEFIARGNYIFPAGPSLRLAVDLFEYCAEHLPRWNFINFCGYHMREAGSSLVQEVAFAFGNAIAYIEAALARGIDLESIAPRFAFNFTVFHHIFEEAAKFRAARRLWARLMKERFGTTGASGQRFRTGAGSGGSSLTAQQPENNIVRVTLQALAAVLGGAQQLHTASMDEALGLPSERACTIALRTQQIMAYESGAGDVIDPLGGSYYVEALTDEIEKQVVEYLQRIDAIGGMLKGIESGWVQREIAENAYRQQREVETGQRTVVGVNRFAVEEPLPFELHRPDPSVGEEMAKALRELRQNRDNAAVEKSLARLREAARSEDNLMPLTLEAVREYATVGEVCNTLREVFGEYRPPTF